MQEEYYLPDPRGIAADISMGTLMNHLITKFAFYQRMVIDSHVYHETWRHTVLFRNTKNYVYEMLK